MRLSQKEIKEMPIANISFPREVGVWQKQWFRDIIERNAIGGDIYTMMTEAYVLGMHHCLKAQSSNEYRGTDDK